MPDEPPIIARNLQHFYGEGSLRKQILFDINLQFDEAEIVILTGPSGSGKTTLLTLAGALRSVQEGSMRVLGQELRDADKDTLSEIRKSIGFIFQAHNLLEALTARQNVQMSLALNEGTTREEADAKTVKILESVGLANRIDYHPNHLSGGQKQRVAIARALVNRPKIILADEPTAALDKKSGREVVQILHDLAKQQGTTILLVTHDNRILDVADRILTLEDGRISSFTKGLTASAGQMLNTLSTLNRRGLLAAHIKGLPTDRFLAVLQESTGELEQLMRTLEASRQQVSQSMLDEVIEAATYKFVDILQADRGTIFLIDEAKGELRSKVATAPGVEPLTIVAPLGDGIVGQVARTGEGLNISDVQAHPLFNRKMDQSTGYQTRSMVCLPILDHHGKVFAVVQLLNKKGAAGFSTKDEQTLAEFVRPLGSILENCVRLENPEAKLDENHSNDAMHEASP
jgi:putative ABC transport system ATP-binding protein